MSGVFGSVESFDDSAVPDSCEAPSEAPSEAPCEASAATPFTVRFVGNALLVGVFDTPNPKEVLCFGAIEAFHEASETT